MKGFRLAAALLMLAVPIALHAQNVVQDGQSTGNHPGSTTSAGLTIPPSFGVQQSLLIGGLIRADSTQKALTMDSNGNLMVSEASPAYGLLYNYPSIINQQLIAGNRDSSAAYPVAGANHIYLYFTVLDTSAARISLWSLLVTRHQNTSVDSLSSWPDVPLGTNGVVASGIGGFRHNAAADTIGTMASDSSAVLNTSQPWAREYVVVFPNGMAAPRRQFSAELCDRAGKPLTAVYLSVRMRLLNVAGGAATFTPIAARSFIRVDMQATR